MIGKFNLRASIGEPVEMSMRVVCLQPSFQPYRIPMWDAMHNWLGDDFVVLTVSRQPSVNDYLAQDMGRFRRRVMTGGFVSLSRHEAQGLETPRQLIWAPTLLYHLRAEQPDVVISPNFSLWTMTALAMRYPTVLFWEGTKHTERTVGGLRQRNRRWIVRRSNAFVACGPNARDYLVDELGAPAGRIFIGGNAPLPAPVALRNLGPRTAQANELIRFLFVGQLVGRKGPEHLLAAAARLKHLLPADRHFEVWIVGDGSTRHALEQQAYDTGIGEQVRFAGFVSIDDIWTYYEKCHVFVLPTLHDNWPLVVTESMQLGMPLLLSKFAGSAPELVREGENGFTFDPFDHESLANKMATYVNEPNLVQLHGARSQDIGSQFTPEWAASAFLEAAEFVAKGNR